MPIFEYSCRKCAHQFEALVLKKTVPACPECKSQDLEKLLSLPVVKSSTTAAQIRRETTKRDTKQAAEREYTQRQYEANHDD
jgi:putative FmdB family regulatory protein